MRDLLRGEGLLQDGIECSTVHRFQGREKDLIVLDLVDTAPLPPGRLLADPSPNSGAAQLLNVSLSRARGKLVVIADLAYFRLRLPTSPLRNFLDRAVQVGTLKTSEDDLGPYANSAGRTVVSSILASSI